MRGFAFARRCRLGFAAGMLALGAGTSPAPAVAAGSIEGRPGLLEETEEEAQRARSLGELVDVGIYTGSELQPDSNFGDFDARIYQPSGRVKVTLPVSHDAALRLVVRGAAQLWDFRNVSTNLFGAPTHSDPFGNLYHTGFELQGGYRLPWRGLFSEHERWTLVGELTTRSRWEEGSSFAEGIEGGGALGVGYRLAKRLEVILGAGVGASRFDGNVGAYPVFEFNWNFADRWRLRSRGRGGQIEYEVTDDLTAFALGRMDSHSYTLAERPGIGAGRLRDATVPVALGVRWDASPALELTLQGGAVVRQELRSYDQDNRSVERVRAGPAPFFAVQIHVTPQGFFAKSGQGELAQREPADPGSSSTSISTSR